VLHEQLLNTVSLLEEVLEDENRCRRFAMIPEKTCFMFLAVNAKPTPFILSQLSISFFGQFSGPLVPIGWTNVRILRHFI
jgi:hypothetical protein